MQKNLHTEWKLRCKEINIKDDWPYKDKNGTPYRIYKYE